MFKKTPLILVVFLAGCVSVQPPSITSLSPTAWVVDLGADYQALPYRHRSAKQQYLAAIEGKKRGCNMIEYDTRMEMGVNSDRAIVYRCTISGGQSVDEIIRMNTVQ